MEDHYQILNNLAEEFMSTAKSKGFYSGAEYNLSDDVASMHAEVSELYEAYKRGKMEQPCDKSADMLSKLGQTLTCQEEEAADLIIKALCIAKALNIDIVKSVRLKNAYNKTRPYRHGKK